MRNLVLVAVLVFVTLVLTATAADPRHLVPYPPSEEVAHETTQSVGHLVVLGALQKVNHEIRSERSILVSGKKEAFTWYLPQARRTEQVAEYFKSQMTESGQLLFECRGRSCGSSSYWANKHFNRAILYGPEQYQHYFVVEDADGYIVVYVSERATRKIYAHIEYVSSPDA